MIIMCIDPKLSEEPVKTREMLTKKKNGKVKRMYCSKCGAKVEGMFCPNCGAKMEQKAAEVPENKATTPVTQPVPPKTEPAPPVTQPKPASGATATKTAVPVAKSADTKKLGLIVGAIVALVVVIAIVSSVVKNVKNSPEWRLNKALDDRDIEMAVDIYLVEYEDDEGLSKKSVEKVVECISELKENYYSGSVTYDEADDLIFRCRNFSSDEVDELLNSTLSEINSEEYVRKGDEAFENGDYSGAYEYYSIALNRNENNLSAQAGLTTSAEGMKKEWADEIANYFQMGELDYAEDEMLEYEGEFGESRELRDAYIQSATVCMEEFLDSEVFYEAAKMIIRTEDMGEDVSDMLEIYSNRASQTIRKMVGNEDYSDAKSVIGTTEGYLEKERDMAAALKKVCKEDMLAQAKKVASKNDYDEAYDVLSYVEDYIGADADIVATTEEISTMYAQHLSDEVMTLADGGNWDGALKKLDEYQQLLPSSQILSATRDEIESTMPITLENLTLVSGNQIEIYEGAVKDRWGNLYDGAVRYCAYKENNYGEGLYNLNKEFARFTGVAFVGQNDDNNTKDNVSLSIYLDEKLVYYADQITTETAPMTLNIDVTNATTMRIVVTNGGGSYSDIYRGVYFGNTNFERSATEKQPVKEQPIEDVPTEELPAEDVPVDEPAVDEPPFIGEVPTDEPPAEEVPTWD